MELEVNAWAQQQFGACELGDRRRTARAVRAAALFAADPSASTPAQAEQWSELKAIYRLFDQEEVTFEALMTPHWNQTRARASGHYLLLGDTTIVSFPRDIAGMGIVEGHGSGYLLHSSLMVSAEREEIFGLAGQTIYYRQAVPTGEKLHAKLNRARESEIWGEVIDKVGVPAADVRYTHVFDRGADNFEVYCHLLLKRADWVVRASNLTRRLDQPGGETSQQLQAYLAELPSAGSYEMQVSANRNQSARRATVEVRFGTISMPIPKNYGRYAKVCGIRRITMNVVEVLETHPPAETQPLRWVLYTSHVVQNFKQAWQVIGYYEKRPLIEEFHKALKMGCSLEARQYRTAARFAAVTAVLSVVALRLLQLRVVARLEPDRPAEEVVPRRWIRLLAAVRRRPLYTVREFYRALAGFGGFLGRKSDGEPGWITLWRGFEKLQLCLRGADALKTCG